jgi:flagellar secretion chaperone FliS
MDPRHAAIAYRNASIENAPPVKVVRMLYDGAIRYIERAETQLERDDVPGCTLWVGRADAIVEELRLALDPSHDNGLCTDLDRLYDFVQERLARAVVDRRRQALGEARQVLATLLEGWARVDVDSRHGGRA